MSELKLNVHYNMSKIRNKLNVCYVIKSEI